MHGFLEGCQEQGYTGTHTHKALALRNFGCLDPCTPGSVREVSDNSPDPRTPGPPVSDRPDPRTPWPPVSDLPDHSQTTAVSDLPDPCTPSSVRPPRPLYTQQCTGVHTVPPLTPVHPGQQCQTSMTTRTQRQCQTSLTPVHPAVSDFHDPCTPSSVRRPRPLCTQQCHTSLTLYTKQCQTSLTPVCPAASDTSPDPLVPRPAVPYLPDPCTPSSVIPP